MKCTNKAEKAKLSHSLAIVCRCPLTRYISFRTRVVGPCWIVLNRFLAGTAAADDDGNGIFQQTISLSIIRIDWWRHWCAKQFVAASPSILVPSSRPRWAILASKVRPGQCMQRIRNYLHRASQEIGLSISLSLTSLTISRGSDLHRPIQLERRKLQDDHVRGDDKK